jgi:pimeloyl-ACP methyl ester carboxylesterase
MDDAHPKLGKYTQSVGDSVSGTIFYLTGNLPTRGGRANMMSVSTLMPSQGSMIPVNGMEMYYEVYGEGAPLVLLHGFTQTASFWQPYIAAFAEHFRLIVPDLRGHGRSTNPTKQFTHRQAALDIFALLDQLAIHQFRAIGFSSGAHSLLHMATQQPPRIEAMVLIGTAPYIPEQVRAIFRQQLASNSKAWDWTVLRQRHVYGDEQIRALLDQLDNFNNIYDDVNFTPPYLATIRAKTLMVNGDRDMLPALLPVEMYMAIPQAHLWIVPNGAHFPFKEQSTQLFTETMLEFLQGHWESNLR